MMQNLPVLSGALPLGSLEAYIARVNLIPILTQEEESTLASQFHKNQDLEAAKSLVLAHLRFVVRVARGYLGYGLPLGDLIQEGNIGLMKAVKRFDPSVGVRLVSFAVHWIKAEIHEFILRNWSIVKVATTKAQRKLFFNLRKAAKRLGWFTEEEIHTVADELQVPPEEVRRMEMRLNAHHESFEGSVDEESGESSFAPEQYLEDHRYNPALQCENKDWSESREQNLQDALSSLDARSQDIVRSRWLVEDKATLHDLAARYQVSAERVRQIEKIAMDKLKKALAEGFNT